MEDTSSEPSFFKTFLLATVLLFATPLITYGFSAYATHRQDSDFLDGVTDNVRSRVMAHGGGEELEREMEAFLEKLPPASDLCRNEIKIAPEMESLRETVQGEVCYRYEQFDLAKAIALGSIALGGLIWMVAMLSAFVAHKSNKLQYSSFVTGWWFLRITGTIQLILQGAMLVWLSYWLIAFFFHVYSVKLIGVVGLATCVAVYAAIRAIFSTPNLDVCLSGTVLTREQAPLLWQRIDELCASLNTEAPKNLILGIDENFFVTATDVHVEQEHLTGRSLYASISLLSVLTGEEAEAVLAHEMAHFSGGDVDYTQKLSPKLAAFENYLEAIGIAVPVYLFMGSYYLLFTRALRKDDRQREFRADKVAAQCVSPTAVANSLIKVAGYASYRQRVHMELFDRDSMHEELNIPRRIEQGIESYAKSDFAKDIASMSVPHPFDSHPLLKERIEAVGLNIDEKSYGDILMSKGDSWYGEIESAAQIEEKLWEIFEQEFATDHEKSLAFRYLPATPKETELVRKHFPDMEFAGTKGDNCAYLTFSELRWSKWPGSVELCNIQLAQWVDHPPRRYQLVLKLIEPVGGKSKLQISSDKLVDRQGFREALELYLLRFRESQQYQAFLQANSSLQEHASQTESPQTETPPVESSVA